MRVRRVAGTVVLAAALAFSAPIAAHADYEYPADEPPIGAFPEPDKEVSRTVKAVGETTVVQLFLDETFDSSARSYLVITGTEVGAETVEIAGRVEAVTSAAGWVARFPVTKHVPGVFTLQGYAVNLDGQRVPVGAPQVVTVTAPGEVPPGEVPPGEVPPGDATAPPAVPGEVPPGDAAAPPSVPGAVPSLPVTGAEAVLFGTGAALLVAVGGTLVIGARRRRSAG